MEKTNLLPLGSVVYLKEGTKKVMIISRGIIMKNGEDRIFFDYGGVLFPEGLQDDKMAYFQHENIMKVVFEGYRDLDDEAIVARISDYLESHPEIQRGDIQKMAQSAE